MRFDKILVIGIDGTDPKIMEELICEGLVPNFEKLSKQGTFKKLNTTLIPQSPVAWSSIATGCNPGKHNIFDFIKRDPKNYSPKLAILEQRGGLFSMSYEPPIKGKPFWDITSEAGIPTTVIRWPLTFPAAKIKGRMFSGLGTPDIKGLLNSYNLYTDLPPIEKEEGAEKVIHVDFNGSDAETFVLGPISATGKPARAPMRIMLGDDGIKIDIDGKEHVIQENSWSDWMRARFKIGFKKIYGVFKLFLISTKPFRMYMSSVQIDPENSVLDISHPKEYSKELVEKIGIYNTSGMPEDTKALENDHITEKIFLQQANHIEDEREAMFWHEFERFNVKTKAVFAFVFDSSDRIMHCFLDKKSEGKDKNHLHDAVVDYYKRKDVLIGKVLEQLDDKTALFIISDHGFTSFDRSVSINTWLWKNGYMNLKQEPTEQDAGDLFKFVDWSKTRAYSLGFSGIYINTKGREGKGIVKPEERHELADEIARKLGDLEENGKKVVTRCYTREEIYTGQYVENSPDLLVGFEPGYRMAWQNAVGGMTQEIITDNDKKWRSDHIVDASHVPGIIFSNLKINSIEISQMDIAPTILDVLGMNVPANMDGKTLRIEK